MITTINPEPAMRIECTLEEFYSLFPATKKRERRCRNTWPASYGRLPPMRWTQSVYQQVMQEIGAKPPELGGILLGPKEELLATHFAFDDTGRGTSVTWTFGHNRINEMLRQYAALKLDMKGFIHSHPAGVTSLSGQDVNDFRKPFANGRNKDLTEVWAPILVGQRVIPYILLRDQAQPVLAQLILL